MFSEKWAGFVVGIPVTLSLFLAVPCAQGQLQQDHSCTVDAAGILALPVGRDGENFDKAGWGFQAGGGWALGKVRSTGWQWFLTGNYLYDRFKANAQALGQAKAANPQLEDASAAHGDFSAVTIDVNPRLNQGSRYSFYAITGGGWLRRAVNFNGVNPGTLQQSSAPSLERLSSNSGVFDAGVGVNVSPLKLRGLKLFGEVRVYHGLAINNGSTLVPISLGVRW